MQRWDSDRSIDRDTWPAARRGLLGLSYLPGGVRRPETDYRFRRRHPGGDRPCRASALQSGSPPTTTSRSTTSLRHATDEQRARWLPGFVTGETIGAIAMSEPGSGSDPRGIGTTAVRDGDGG